MLFENIKERALVDIVVLDAVNVDVGAFGAFVTAAQAGQFDFGFQSVFIQKTLDNLKVLLLPRAKQELPIQTFIVDAIFITPDYLQDVC